MSVARVEALAEKIQRASVPDLFTMAAGLAALGQFEQAEIVAQVAMQKLELARLFPARKAAK